MWSRRKEEEYTPKQSQNPPQAEPKEAIPVSTMPSRTVEPDLYRSGAAASIGKSVMIKGQIISREDLYLDGAPADHRPKRPRPGECQGP
jgi:hypothetical protein